MLRSLTAAATLAVATLTIAPAASAAPTPAGSVTDPTGDYDSLFKKTAAPRASIDIKQATATPMTVNGHRGTTITITVKNVRTAAESKVFKQRFIVTTDTIANAVTFRRDGKVYGFVDGDRKVCGNAVRAFNTITNEVAVFIPNACLGKFTTAKVETVIQDNHRVYADDVTDQFSW